MHAEEDAQRLKHNNKYAMLSKKFRDIAKKSKVIQTLNDGSTNKKKVIQNLDDSSTNKVKVIQNLDDSSINNVFLTYMNNLDLIEQIYNRYGYIFCLLYKDKKKNKY
jgi:hypothetical protein